MGGDERGERGERGAPRGEDRGDAALRALYQATIMRHARAPRGFGPLDGATHVARGDNPVCGDRVALSLRCARGEVVAAGFEGAGCALSIASASLLTDAIGGLTLEAARALGARVLGLVGGAPPSEADAASLGEVACLASVRPFPARHRCVTLAWDALLAALDG